MKQANDRWSDKVTDVLFVYNPKASNYKRAVEWMETLTAHLDVKPHKIDVLREGATLNRTVEKLLGQTGRTVLVAIAGGDGTVSSVVNRLMKVLPEVEAIDESTAGRVLLFPLWGGNANDMACMLNGLSSSITASQLLARSKLIAVPLIKIELAAPADLTRDTNAKRFEQVPSGGGGNDRDDGGGMKTVYACCYASFGASAYAARQLDREGFAKQKFIQYFPPVIVAREFVTVLKAIGGAAPFRAKIGKTEAKLYEHTLVNGSRLAKMNRIPVELTEPLFFHAVVTKKNPSVILELLRVATRRRSPIYSTKSHHSFVLHDRIDAQVDGELYKLAAGTEVTATSIWPSFSWVSVVKTGVKLRQGQ